MAENSDDKLLDAKTISTSNWDKKEWKWERKKIQSTKKVDCNQLKKT